MSKPSLKVTIGIPTFNRLRYVQEAINSARKQTYDNVEIVVSDNASDDGTWRMLEQIDDPRLVLIRHKSNLGSAANLNTCLKKASGDLFLLLGDDDELAPEAIERLSAPFLSRIRGLPAERVGLAWCPCKIIDREGSDLWETARGPGIESAADFMVELFNGRRGPRLSGVLVRTEDALREGGYNQERYEALCDTGLWGAVALRYTSVVCVPEVLVRYRVHPNSHTSQSLCADWQRWGRTLNGDLVAILQAQGDKKGALRLRKAGRNLLANLTVDVLMRGITRAGWWSGTLKEFWSSRAFMLTPFVAKRILKDGWKLLRLK